MVRSPSVLAVYRTEGQTRRRDITSEFETSFTYTPRFFSCTITLLARSRARARAVRRRRESKPQLSLLFGSCQLPLTQLPRLCSPASRDPDHFRSRPPSSDEKKQNQESGAIGQKHSTAILRWLLKRKCVIHKNLMVLQATVSSVFR